MPDLSLLAPGKEAPRRRRRSPSPSARQNSRSPFRIVPWDDDFLLRIHALADELTGGHPGKAVIVFPLKRPRRYQIGRAHV